MNKNNIKIGEFFTHMVDDEVKDIFILSELETVKNENVNSKIAHTYICVRMGRNGFACIMKGKQEVCWVDYMREATKDEKEFYNKCVTSNDTFIQRNRSNSI
jgi:hypothetical protein